MRGLLVLLVLLPVLDLALLGHWIGFWNTVLLVIGTALLGFMLIRYQGLMALKASQQKLQAGVLPVTEITTGLFLAFAGVLFIHPGFVTDLLGLLFLVPGVRLVLAAWLMAKLGLNRVATQARSAGAEDVIEGEFEEMPKRDAAHIEQEKK
ncbi:FxsA family protein [Marinagarivorans algicola]|uniref:FxsA family protein n=1 Tax=Marinagarivorans algicola TaxID=1513270 RepID=UPI0006B6584C|nr:FxsA family protein [Marinagarivorans algicola]